MVELSKEPSVAAAREIEEAAVWNESMVLIVAFGIESSISVG